MNIIDGAKILNDRLPPNRVEAGVFTYDDEAHLWTCEASDLTGLLTHDPRAAGITIVGTGGARHFTFDESFHDDEGELRYDRFLNGSFRLEVFND